MSAKILVVKTTSMGDVVHALPVVADIAQAHPEARIDWLVEAPFAAIPRLHPGVREVFALSWRKWRRRLFERATWQAMAALRERLRAERYDVVLDLQGLVKSALWARQAIGPLCGYDRASAREGAAVWLYARTARVPKSLPAVERCRRLAAAHLGYALPATPPRFGLRVPPPVWQAPERYAVLIPNASRADKLWPEARWVAVGRRLAAHGWRSVVLWGSDAEQTLAEHIAAGCDGAVPSFLSVHDMAAVLAGAQTVVGLDTGFTHLAAAYGRPTIGIYCDHDPGLAAVTGPGGVHSIGGKGRVPKLAEVMALLDRQHGPAPVG